ncbi:MAG: 30S ribosomal protein S4 [Kiritimatiellia bacterium]|nr:30S ribosomal protein S4 [Kiritimatiellia bacterium]
MGRYTGPVCRMCRREGMQLFLKGDRCFMAKCPIQTQRPPPGQHGQRRRKLSDYALQLREKQRLRRIYGMQEGQFRGVFDKALHRRGVTGEVLLQMLEMRLDTLVHRLGFAMSRSAARQMVLHGHIHVNGHKANVPSMTLRAGDKVSVAPREAVRAAAKITVVAAESRGIAAWLILDKEQLSGEIRHIPSRDEIAPLVNEQRVVELYSK